MIIDSFRGEYAFLSNFYWSKVTYKNIVLPTNEHAFQLAKIDFSKDKSLATKIVLAASPSEAKSLGRKIPIDREAWEEGKVHTMRYLLKRKFNDNLELKAKLKQTSPHMLIEGNTWGDNYWGQVDGKGDNVLGCLLMELRGSCLNEW